MALEGQFGVQGNLVAATDLSADSNHYRLIQIDTTAADTGKLVATLGVRVDGVLLNKPAAGKAMTLAVSGFPKCKAGAAIASAGLELTADATGRAITASSGQFVFAISRNAVAAADEFVGIHIIGPYVKA